MQINSLGYFKTCSWLKPLTWSLSLWNTKQVKPEDVVICIESTGKEGGRDVMWRRFREKRIWGKAGGLAPTAGCDWYEHKLACLPLSSDVRAVPEKREVVCSEICRHIISASVSCLIWTGTWLYAHLHATSACHCVTLIAEICLYSYWMCGYVQSLPHR